MISLRTFTLRFHTDLGNVRPQDIPSGGIIALADSDVSTSGSKAAACGLLASLAAASARGKVFLRPSDFVTEPKFSIFGSVMVLRLV